MDYPINNLQYGILWIFALVLIVPFCGVCQSKVGDEGSSVRMKKLGNSGVVKMSLPTTKFIDRADLYFWTPETAQVKTEGVLVLLPGRNGNGREFVKNSKWKNYATENRLTLCGFSFSSDKHLIEESYSNAHSGSGKMLLEGIEHYFGKERGARMPILIYGFSAGARFTASFVEANPERVVAWCGYAVSRWQKARETKLRPPGIVASGEWDAGSYHASLLYFQQGRKLGKPWVWLSLKEIGHRWSSDLDEFVKVFFSDAIAVKNKGGIQIEGSFRDIDSRKELTKEEVESWPVFSVWLPTNKQVQDHWMKIHHP